MRDFKLALKGSVGPEDNDSRNLLDPHRRGVPGRATMRTYRDRDAVDLVIVGCGAGEPRSRSGWPGAAGASW